MNTAALRHVGLPLVDGFYWMAVPGFHDTPIVVDVRSEHYADGWYRQVFSAGREDRFDDHVVARSAFWGPIVPPDELVNPPKS